MIGAPIAVAQVCEPGQVEIDGKCTVPDNNASNVPAPPDGGKLLCNQRGHCTYFPGG
jgi:hypothetical protein